MNKLFPRLAPAMALSLPLLAIAQQSNDSAHAQSPAQPLRYESAFAGYKPWQDAKPGDWRKLNDDLRPVPGAAAEHVGHGAAAPAASHGPASALAGASEPSALATQHQGHHMHGGRP